MIALESPSPMASRYTQLGNFTASDGPCLRAGSSLPRGAGDNDQGIGVVGPLLAAGMARSEALGDPSIWVAEAASVAARSARYHACPGLGPRRFSTVLIRYWRRVRARASGPNWPAR